MAIRVYTISLQGKRPRRFIAVVILCMLFGVASAEDPQEEIPETAVPESDATENSMPEIRIKRLRLADPESRETMLVGIAAADAARHKS